MTNRFLLLGRATLLLVVSLQLNAQWTGIGPFGGAATVVQSDPNIAGTLIAGAANGLLFRSRDNAENWEALNFPPQLRSVLHTVVANPMVANVYLAGVSPESPDASGMWQSGDGGSTWTPVYTFTGLQVRAIAMFRGDSQVIAAGTNVGIFQSVDGGSTWSRISPAGNLELQPVVSLTFDPNESQTIYAGTPHLPWKTIDGGVTWRSIHTGMIDDSDVFAIIVDRNRPERVFASACSGIFRSLNGGLNWTKAPEVKTASHRTYTIVQDPQYEKVLFAGTSQGLIRSADRGTTWQRIAPYTTRSIAFDLKRPGRIFIATEQAGILRTNDNGQTWLEANRGFSNRRLTPLAMGAGGEVYTGTVEPDERAVFRLASDADDWVKDPSAPSTIALPSKQRPTEVIALPRGRNRMIAIAGTNLFFTRDSAQSWQEVHLPGAGTVRSIVALDPPWIAAVTPSDIFLSADGEHWRTTSRLPRGEIVHGIAASTGGNLIAATSRGLRVSSDLGASWIAAGGPLEGNTIQAICRHPLQPAVLFAARYGLIFRSQNGGRSWERISPEGWSVGSIHQLLVVPGVIERLLVLTRQQGVFVLPLAASVDLLATQK